MQTVRDFDRVLQGALATGAVATLLLMLVCMGSQVTMRYVFNHPLVWSEELARFAMIWMAFLSIALGFRRGLHVRLEGVKIVPAAAQPVVARFVSVVIVGLLAIMLFYGWQLTTRTMGQVSAALQIPMGLIYAAIPASALCMIFSLAVRWASPTDANTVGDSDSTN